MRGSLSALSLLALLGSCIPSHRLVHDGDRYFEQCYGADFAQNVQPTQREACWQAWLAHYTRYQPAHRVDYAMRRVEALQQGEPAPALPGLASSAGSHSVAEGEQVALESVVPRDPAIPAAAPNEARDEIPNGCLETCNVMDARCVSHCPAGSTSCRIGCTRERAICLGGCH